MIKLIFTAILLSIAFFVNAQSITAAQFKKTVDSLGVVIKALRSKDTVLTNANTAQDTKINSAISINTAQDTKINSAVSINTTQDSKLKVLGDSLATIRPFVLDSTMNYKKGATTDTLGTKPSLYTTSPEAFAAAISNLSGQIANLSAMSQQDFILDRQRILTLETWKGVTQVSINDLLNFMYKLQKPTTISITGQLNIQ